VASASAASASTSVVLKRAKNLRVSTSLGGVTSATHAAFFWYCAAYAAGLLASNPPGWQRTWFSQTCLLGCPPSAEILTPVGRLYISHTGHYRGSSHSRPCRSSVCFRPLCLRWRTTARSPPRKLELPCNVHEKTKVKGILQPTVS
jgi:hypothetical protein